MTMKLGLKLVLSLLLSIGAGSACAQQISLGAAGAYSAFIFRHASNFVDVEGRLAVGGNLFVQGTSIGGSLPMGSTQPSLIVGGDILGYGWGIIWAGILHNGYGLYRGNKSAWVPGYLDLRKSEALGLDFEAERDSLSFLSKQLDQTAATGTVTSSYGQITLIGAGKKVEVFNLSADQVLIGHDLHLKNIRGDAYIVINIGADPLRMVHFGIAAPSLFGRENRVLFNFHDAQVLQFTNVQVWGSILAPYACICRSSGHISGNVIADMWDSPMEIGYAPFSSMQ